MEKEQFKNLLKTSQVVVSINPFDYAEESARYRMNPNGDVYEMYDERDNEKFLFNINNEEELQKLYDEVLCHVVNFSYTTTPDQFVNYHFAKCVEYIKEHLEHWEIEQGWSYIGKRMGLPNELVGRIYDLIDDFTEDNDLTDDWWNDYDAEDFFMEIENE